MIRSHYTHIQLDLLEPREGVNIYTKWLGGAGLCLPSEDGLCWWVLGGFVELVGQVKAEGFANVDC